MELESSLYTWHASIVGLLNVIGWLHALATAWMWYILPKLPEGAITSEQSLISVLFKNRDLQCKSLVLMDYRLNNSQIIRVRPQDAELRQAQTTCRPTSLWKRRHCCCHENLYVSLTFSSPILGLLMIQSTRFYQFCDSLCYLHNKPTRVHYYTVTYRRRLRPNCGPKRNKRRKASSVLKL